ncbi:MAG: proton-conducting transporter membrane subunit [Desulfocapsaceae bacterium]|nr:proton-conducting transporter membrane subunit [Desulfocapsaceae bacterium]
MIHSVLLILSWLMPLLLAATAIIAPRLTWKALVFAGFPGLAAVFLVPVGSSVEVPVLLLGTRFGLDQVGMGFLFLTTVIWILAAWHAKGYITTRRSSFGVYFLLAMSGNFGLILAQDMVGFYLFFALMSFASYGLVIHERTPEARYAGKVYIVLVIIGEVLIFSGMAGVGTLAGTTSFAQFGEDWVSQGRGALFFGALFLGFGIKAGALPLHVWLPLAHPAAPTPASAVLSGAMIKAGLIGWLRFLPIGDAALPGWGAIYIGIGALAFIAAALYGCMQANSKALLAYSSISKMGLMTMAVGVILVEPDSATVVIPCILVFATHHCFCKGALFLSVSINRNDVSPGLRRWLTTFLLLVPPLSLAGFALTSGEVAKTMMKVGLSASISVKALTGLAVLLAINSLLTAGLMFRFCWQRFKHSPHAHQPPGAATFLAWGTLVGIVIISPLLLVTFYPVTLGKSLSIGALWSSIWPVLVVSAIGAVLVNRSWLFVPRWPAGDMLFLYLLLTRLIEWFGRVSSRFATAVSVDFLRKLFIPPKAGYHFKSLLRQTESRLGMATVFGLVFIGLLTLSTYLLFEHI